MVVNADNGVRIFLTQGAHKVVGTLLHLGICTLNGVQFYAVRVPSGVNRRHAAASEANPVVVTADNHNLVSFLRFLLQAVALRAVAHSSGKHYHLVVCVLLVAFLVFEGQHRAANQRLAELVAEV